MKIFLRAWKQYGLEEIRQSLLVMGELRGECFNCHTLEIEKGSTKCFKCGAIFRFIGFRKEVDGSYVSKLKDTYPGAVFIDFGDFKKALSKKQARNILNI